MPQPSQHAIERVAAILGARPVAWAPVVGGYTAASRWIVRSANGRTAFVKAATNANTTEWLNTELRVYSQLTASFLPLALGWVEGEQPILVLQDLSHAFWPPPWTPARVDLVLAALARIAATPPPPGLPALETLRAMLTGWVLVARDPVPLLALGLCSPAWLEAALPDLLRAEAAAVLVGDSLVHCDVRSDNICFVEDGAGGEAALLVDWNWACRGNPRLDIASWLPSLCSEGGPAPETLMPDEPALAALICGFFASRAGQPGAQPLRALQQRQLKAALPWAARLLGLPSPR